MEQKIANEIDEVLGKTSPEDPDANIVLTEYLSDGEDHGETGWDLFLPTTKELGHENSEEKLKLS